MINISGFGLVGQLTASKTFPSGFTVNEFADDNDPLSSPDLDAADTSMGLNGDMIVWSRANGIEIVVSVIPSSPSDTNLDALLEANRVSKNKSSAQDVCGFVFAYPSGLTVTCAKGVIVSGPVMPSVASAGRLKTRQYKFRFESVSKSGQ